MRFGTRGPMAAAAIAVCACAPAFAATESGIAVKVNQAADVGRNGGQLMLREQAPVFMGDVIKTGPVGEAQIRLADDTRLVVGPNSLMTIDRFVFSNNGSSAKQVSLNAVRGAFRFITGNSNHDAYTITTPTATIGVRGTGIDFTVDPIGTSLAVLNGSADLCEKLQRNRCERQVSGCGVAVAPPREPVRRIDENDQRIKALTERFPFIVDQRRLDSSFQVSVDDCDIPPSVILRARIEAKIKSDPSFLAAPPDPVNTGSVEPPPEECNTPQCPGG